MTERDEVPWLTVRRDEMARLERLAAILDEVSGDPFGLAAALRNTPTYQRTVAEFGLPVDRRRAPRAD
jgi:hypothetical protein